jgi:hypothetical protein
LQAAAEAFSSAPRRLLQIASQTQAHRSQEALLRGAGQPPPLLMEHDY